MHAVAGITAGQFCYCKTYFGNEKSRVCPGTFPYYKPQSGYLSAARVTMYYVLIFCAVIIYCRPLASSYYHGNNYCDFNANHTTQLVSFTVQGRLFTDKALYVRIHTENAPESELRDFPISYCTCSN